MFTSYSTIHEPLKKQIEGECFFDEETRQRYSTAACWYKIVPVGVVYPKHAQDVQTIVRFCSENDIAVIPRGGATGLAGQAIGMGIVLDFTKHMNALKTADEHTTTVEPGIILASLNQALATENKYFPIDPASEKVCTVGGMIATNAAGAHGVKYGATKDFVEELTVVLANGELATIKSDYSESELSNTPHLRTIYTSLRDLLQGNRDLIFQQFPKVAKNSSGYNLLDAVKGETFDLRKLLVGSEGTLAVIVGAKLRLLTPPAFRIGLIASFPNYESTVEATLEAIELQPAAIELLDKTYWSLADSMGEQLSALNLEDAQAILYFEFEGDSLIELDGKCKELERILQKCRPITTLPLRTDEERQDLWNLREHVSQKMNLAIGSRKGSFIEDVAVPLAELPAYMRGLQEILSRNGILFSAYGHAGSGNIHCAAFVDPTNRDQYRTIDLVASEVNNLAIRLGGTLSGEHGDGFVRTPFLERLYGPHVYELFGSIKNLFDPKNILNPGKIIGKQNATILHDISHS